MMDFTLSESQHAVATLAAEILGSSPQRPGTAADR